jgi:hypothetical protein
MESSRFAFAGDMGSRHRGHNDIHPDGVGVFAGREGVGDMMTFNQTAGVVAGGKPEFIEMMQAGLALVSFCIIIYNVLCLTPLSPSSD